MGRPEAALAGEAGPLRNLAASLRALREEAGGRSYRQLAKAACFAPSTLAKAASGHVLPSWEVTRAYVLACGEDPARFRPAWDEAARHVRDGAGLPCPAVPAGAAVRQLPADLPDFVGRAAECDLVRAAVQAGPGAGLAARTPAMVVISGLGGVGKTAFAVHVSYQLAGEYPGGQLFADLRAHDDHPVTATQVAVRFLAALGVPEDPAADPVASFRSQAVGRRLLIMLDNAASESQVTPLLPASAQCLVIVTSRQALGGLAGVLALRLDVLRREEAAVLLSQVAGPGQLESAQMTAMLTRLCGYLPLALRLAGARLAAGPSGASGWLAARLLDREHRLRHLTSGGLDLAAVFAVSYQLLPETARRVFRYAGLFPGPDFTAFALAVLCGTGIPDVECALDRLADASLVQHADPGRYRMHDLLHLYARQCAEEETTPADRAAAVRRLAAWYLACVEAADRVVMPSRSRPVPMPCTSHALPQPLADHASASAWYDAEQASLIAVTHAAVRHHQHDIAWRLPVAMRGLLELRGHTEDWIATHRSGLESAQALGDRHAEGWILNGLGIGYWRREAYADAIDCYRKALALRFELADHRGAAAVLNNLGSVYAAMEQYDKAIQCLHEALAIRERIGDELDKSYALNSLGHVQHELGNFSEALPLLQEALRIRRLLGNRNGEAATLHCIGDTLAGVGRSLEALASLRQALLIFRRLGNNYGEAVTLHSIGSVCRGLGRPEHAWHYLRRAIMLYRQLGRGTEEAAATRELSAVGPAAPRAEDNPAADSLVSA